MSKYVKELMMDQLKTELDGDKSVLILDLKGLDAITEYQFRRDLRKKSIKMRVLRNTLARRVFDDMGIGGLSRFLEGPSVAVWGGAGVAELAKEVSDQVKKLKKPEIKGGSVDGTVIGPEQVEDITKLPSREALIGRVVSLAMAPVSAGHLPGQRAGERPARPAQDPLREGPGRRRSQTPRVTAPRREGALIARDSTSSNLRKCLVVVGIDSGV